MISIIGAILIIFTFTQAIWVHADGEEITELSKHFAVQSLQARGDEYLIERKFDEAIASYNAALEIDPNFWPAYNQRGIALINLKEYEAALQDFNKAILLIPNEQFRPYRNRGNVWASLGKEALARQDFNKAIEIDPDEVLAYFERGNSYYRIGQFEQALADYNKAITLDSFMLSLDGTQQAFLYQSRGKLFTKREKFKEAIKDFEAGIKLDPQNPDLYNSRGEAYRRSGNLAKARMDYQKTIELDPKHPAAYYNLGFTYFLMNKPYHSIHAYLLGFLNDDNALVAIKSLSSKDVLSGQF